MELNRSQKIILSIKNARREQHLSIPQVKKLLDASGHFLSESTVRRVFADGSELGRFSYEDTLVPIAEALHVPRDQEEDTIASIEDFVSILRTKNETISQERAEHAKRCREYEERIAFLMDQVKKKDELIARLMERL